MTATRRAFIASLAAGAGVVGAGQASADIADYEAAKPSHVSISYDESTLSSFQPSLYFPSEMTIRPAVIYAWTSESPEWEYDAHTYVVYYQSQQTELSTTSHRHDREIVQVYVDDHGTVRETAYSNGHWSIRHDTEPSVLDDSGEHVQLRVNPEYRHFQPTTKAGDIGIDLEPLGTDETLYTDGEDTQFEVFLANGWDPLLGPGLLQAANRARFAEMYWSEAAPWVDRFAASQGRELAQYGPLARLFPEYQGGVET